MIYVIDDDIEMAECVARVARAKGEEALIFSDVYQASAALSEGLPKMIFLDVFLNGPDGFTLLNELQSDVFTAEIPIVIISSLNLSRRNLSAYGVIGALDKSTMTPGEIEGFLTEALEKSTLVEAGGSGGLADLAGALTGEAPA